MLEKQCFWLRELSQYKEISTLGPEGTSSQAAALYLSSLLSRTFDIKLYGSFELAANHTESNNKSILLVANAYRDIDLFYMTPDLQLAGSFFFAPPNYYICCRDKKVLLQKLAFKKRIRLSTHKAPSSQIPDILNSIKCDDLNIDPTKVEISFEESTAEAAVSVFNDESDLCLVNENAAKLYDLDIISPPMIIEMIWSIFCKSTSKQKISDIVKDSIENSLKLQEIECKEI